MNNHAEAIVIGGGVIGNATAYYLAKRGLSVIVLEGSDYIGNGGSSRNGGETIRTRCEGTAACDVRDQKYLADSFRGTGNRL